MFRDETGTAVPLRVFREEAVVLALVYYSCLMCNLLLNGMTDTLKNSGMLEVFKWWCAWTLRHNWQN